MLVVFMIGADERDKRAAGSRQPPVALSRRAAADVPTLQLPWAAYTPQHGSERTHISIATDSKRTHSSTTEGPQHTYPHYNCHGQQTTHTSTAEGSQQTYPSPSRELLPLPSSHWLLLPPMQRPLPPSRPASLHTVVVAASSVVRHGGLFRRQAAC